LHEDVCACCVEGAVLDSNILGAGSPWPIQVKANDTSWHSLKRLAIQPVPLRNLRHQTVSASKNQGLAAAISSSGDGAVLGSKCARAMTKTSQVVRLVRAKTLLVMWCGMVALTFLIVILCWKGICLSEILSAIRRWRPDGRMKKVMVVVKMSEYSSMKSPAVYWMIYLSSAVAWVIYFVCSGGQRSRFLLDSHR